MRFGPMALTLLYTRGSPTGVPYGDTAGSYAAVPYGDTAGSSPPLRGAGSYGRPLRGCRILPYGDTAGSYDPLNAGLIRDPTGTQQLRGGTNF
jgi:hypothetical protein